MKLFQPHWLFLALFLALTTLRPAAAQTVIHDTFGPANATAGTGFGVAPNEASASPFVSGSTRREFSGVELKLRYVSGPNSVQVVLMSNAVDRPGTVLETMTVFTSSVPFTDALVRADSASKPVLEANTQYWIALIGNGETTMASLFTPFEIRGMSLRSAATGGDWSGTLDNRVAAMRVYAGDEVPVSTDSVPEPGAAVLFLPALAAVALAHRRRGTKA